MYVSEAAAVFVAPACFAAAGPSMTAALSSLVVSHTLLLLCVLSDVTLGVTGALLPPDSL